MSVPDHTGQILDGKYKLLRCLGRGGMGSVYLGKHVVIGRQVAVKLLNPELAGNAEAIKRFYREAQAATAIGHASIIEVFDVGATPSGEPYLVMEFLEGESLAAVIERLGPLPLAAAIGVLEPVLLALSQAHLKGIVHRDLKPDNLFLVVGKDGAPQVKVIDFGVSKITAAAGATKLTTTGSLLGTPAYMAPEQARGASDLDHRIDIYALGVILYEMLTAQLPYTGENYNALLVNMLTAPPRPPSEAYQGFPKEAEPVIHKAMAKDPGERFGSADAFFESLKALPSFSGRREGLLGLISGAKAKAVVAGDLGALAPTQALDGLAEQVLSGVAEEMTPGSGTRVQRPAQRKGLVLGLAIAAAVLLVLVLVLVAGRPGKVELRTDPEPVETPAAKEESWKLPVDLETAGVLITVEGAPTGATIYYDEALVPMNPFRVKRGSVLVALRVEAKGYRSFRISVLPDKDQSVRVSLKSASETRTTPTTATTNTTTTTTTTKTTSTTDRRSNVHRFFDDVGKAFSRKRSSSPKKEGE